MFCCGAVPVAADTWPAGPERGRRSRRRGPRVYGSGPVSRGGGIVPAAQAEPTVTPDRYRVQAHSLMPLLSGEPHLHRAARQCMRRCSAPGADGMSWAQYRKGLPGRITALSAALRDGTWRPGPLRTAEITSYAGKRFSAVIPTAADRIVHRAMRAAIEPVLEERAFPGWVSGYRPGRNRITALRAAMGHLQAGRVAVADVDVEQATAGATAPEVTGWLAAYISDGTFLSRFRTALAMLPEPLVPGTGLSPLLLNLRLSRVDARLAGLAVVRFADNYCAFAASEAAAQAAFAVIGDALAAEGLRPHPVKSRVRAAANAEDLFLIAG
jgi:RNA-directed DNA polymerase